MYSMILIYKFNDPRLFSCCADQKYCFSNRATSVNNVFPEVSLNFAGGATLVLNPEDYLLQHNSIGGVAVWCIGFQKIEVQSITILGVFHFGNAPMR
ncbi:hypothetical protein F3Y22_tig00110348pilonHSYRG00017 [Hibiscus syriacus]|uniref:Xylanase inhibitor C-terminal domain-containing protein n=1 Tax=Hibiscus syriacus TaxID=106335 RepID=A0A6A3AXK9_HIBSY|nr:hypothetical protein F3Y22_tig00110348pilonHSYRG00017 [Hibiscus syriacus]